MRISLFLSTYFGALVLADSASLEAHICLRNRYKCLRSLTDGNAVFDDDGMAFRISKNDTVKTAHRHAFDIVGADGTTFQGMDNLKLKLTTSQGFDTGKDWHADLAGSIHNPGIDAFTLGTSDAKVGWFTSAPNLQIYVGEYPWDGTFDTPTPPTSTKGYFCFGKNLCAGDLRESKHTFTNHGFPYYKSSKSSNSPPRFKFGPNSSDKYVGHDLDNPLGGQVGELGPNGYIVDFSLSGQSLDNVYYDEKYRLIRFANAPMSWGYQVKFCSNPDGSDCGFGDIDITPDPNIPLILVHGLGDGPSVWDDAEPYLKPNYSGQIIRYDYSAYTQNSIESNALNFYLFLAERHLLFRHINIVAHSMGGLVARYAMHYAGYPLNGLNDRPIVDHLITLATPNQGTALANWCNAAPNFCGDSTKELAMDSSFIKKLSEATSRDYSQDNTLTYAIEGDGMVYGHGSASDEWYVTKVPGAKSLRCPCSAIEVNGETHNPNNCGDIGGKTGVHRSITRRKVVLDDVLSFTNGGKPR